MLSSCCWIHSRHIHTGMHMPTTHTSLNPKGPGLLHSKPYLDKLLGPVIVIPLRSKLRHPLLLHMAYTLRIEQHNGHAALLLSSRRAWSISCIAWRTNMSNSRSVSKKHSKASPGCCDSLAWLSGASALLAAAAAPRAHHAQSHQESCSRHRSRAHALTRGRSLPRSRGSWGGCSSLGPATCLIPLYKGSLRRSCNACTNP